jgi:pimeloyl-ACP methyl ester carboxylesterase
LKIFLFVAGFFIVALLGGLIYEKVSENGDAARFPAPGQLYEVGGRKLHLTCEGSGSPTVVLEAGGSSTSTQWGPVQEQLAEFSRVCSYDRAGFGWSDPSSDELSFENGARDLNALLAAAEVPGPYILVGHSKGGFHVRTFARLYPDDVSGVLLLDANEEEHTFPMMEMLNKQAASGRLSALLARFGVVRFILRFAPGALSLPGIPEEIRPALFSQLASPNHFTTASREVDAFRSTPTVMRVAGGLGVLGDVPLIVITHGIPFTGGMAFLEEGWSAGQERLAGLSSDSELLVAENSGHGIPWDEPEFVMDSVRRLISKAGSHRLH